MKLGRGFLPKDSIYPFEGLNTLDPATLLSPRASPVFQNLIPIKGLIQKRKGYVQLGSTLNGIPMALINFQKSDGTEKLVCVTTTKQYTFNTGTGAWDNITKQTASADVDWTGDETNVVNWTVATGTQGTWLIVTNGKDKPRYWDGGAGLFLNLENAPSWAAPVAGFVTCKDIKSFYNRLVMINVTGSSEAPFSVYYSILNSLVDFTASGSGAFLLSNASGPLRRCEPLADRLVIYSDEGIDTMQYVGGTTTLFTFEHVSNDTRILGPRTVVNVGAFHLYLGRENIKQFDGSRLSRDFADAISRTYREEIFLDIRHRAFSFIDTAKGNLYFAVPVDSSTTIFYLCEYDQTDFTKLRWARWIFAHRVTCIGFYAREATLCWNSPQLASKTWADMNITWDQGSLAKGAKVRIMGLSDGKIVLADDSNAADISTAVDAIYESPDYVVPQEYLSSNATWLELEVELRGTSADILYSVDQGMNFTSLVSGETLTSDWQKFRYPMLVNSRLMRFRVRNNASTGSGFECKWLRVWLRPSSPV